MGSTKEILHSVWDFIWNSDSIWSWIINIILAFVLIKFLVYPALGLILGSSHPVVAVVSDSMEHKNIEYDDWWEAKGKEYDQYGIDKYRFASFKYKDGFDTGDIMMLKRVGKKGPQVGDIIVYQGTRRTEPIIHRIVKIEEKDGKLQIYPKGDHNEVADFNPDYGTAVTEDQIIGKAFFRIRWLGWIKMGFMSAIDGVKDVIGYIDPIREATPLARGN